MSREVAESSSLEDIPNPPGCHPVQRAPDDPAQHRVGLGHLQRSLPTTAILWYQKYPRGLNVKLRFAGLPSSSAGTMPRNWWGRPSTFLQTANSRQQLQSTSHLYNTPDLTTNKVTSTQHYNISPYKYFRKEIKGESWGWGIFSQSKSENC